jgi:hypothetical protein
MKCPEKATCRFKKQISSFQELDKGRICVTVNDYRISLGEKNQ